MIKEAKIKAIVGAVKASGSKGELWSAVDLFTLMPMVCSLTVGRTERESRLTLAPKAVRPALRYLSSRGFFNFRLISEDEDGEIEFTIENF